MIKCFRWLMSAITALALMVWVPAFADAQTGELSGTAQWPVFRDLQWSMDENVVMLLEEERGAKFEVRDAAAPVRVYVNDEMEILGQKARVAYAFSDEMGLHGIIAHIAIDGDETACTEKANELCAALEQIYGEPRAKIELAEGWSAALKTGDSNILDIANWGRDTTETSMSLPAGENFLEAGIMLSVMPSGEGYAVVLSLAGGYHVNTK